MNDQAHAEEILEAARRDLRALRGMNDTEVFSDEIFGFHAQQSVEKALKAWLAFLGQRFPKTHDLKQLIDFSARAGYRPTEWTPSSISMPSQCSTDMNPPTADEETLDRLDLANKIERLISQVAGAIRG